MAAAYTEILIPSEIKYSLRDTGSHDALQHVTNFAADHRVVQTRARTAIAPTGTLEAKGKRTKVPASLTPHGLLTPAHMPMSHQTDQSKERDQTDQTDQARPDRADRAGETRETDETSHLA